MRFIAVLEPEGSSTNSTPVYSSLLNPAHNWFYYFPRLRTAINFHILFFLMAIE
jgi:hypothetical protein